MNDRLEEFVRQHRDQFDPHEPDPSIWLKINPGEGKTGERKAGERKAGERKAGERKAGEGKVGRESRPMRWLRVAAAVAVIFAGSAAGIYFLTGERTGSGPYSSELYLEIQETEAYYGQMVAERYDELQPFLEQDPAAKEMLNADMDELDQVYDELKEDLKDNASNPEVIEAMILNYRMKLEILEDLLYQLKDIENEKDEENGSYVL